MSSEIFDTFPYANLARYGSVSHATQQPASTAWPEPDAEATAAPADENAAGRKVLLLGGNADYNLGDQASLHALCEALQTADPGVRITIQSSRWPVPRFPGVVRVIPHGAGSLPALLNAARKQDAVVVGRGRLFQDGDSRIQMPYWAALLKMLSLCNGNVHAHALGAGPLQHPESRWAARQACKVLRSVSTRDSFGQDLLAGCDAPNVSVAPDPAFALSPATPETAHQFLQGLGIERNRPIIGVTVCRLQQGGRPLLDGHCDDVQLARLFDEVAAAVGTLARRMDAAVLLLPTCDSGWDADSAYCHQLAAMLPLDTVRVVPLDDPRLYKAVCGRLSLMISARMHPLILAAGMGVPGIGLANRGRFEGYFEMLGLPPRLLWLDDFNDGNQAERLVAMGEEALSDRTDLRDRCELIRRRVIQDASGLLEMPAARVQC
jgi:polysaccharide pyruvyl transferase WcaK-like protein